MQQIVTVGTDLVSVRVAKLLADEQRSVRSFLFLIVSLFLTIPLHQAIWSNIEQPVATFLHLSPLFSQKMCTFADDLIASIMTKEQLGYDKTSIASIFKYSQRLIGHSLRELVSEEEQQTSNLQGHGKGGLGQMIEELFFHYPIKSDHAPDFREAGIDLKATGLKELVSGELSFHPPMPGISIQKLGFCIPIVSLPVHGVSELVFR